MRETGSLKSFFSYAPQLSGLGSCVFTFWASFPQGSGEWIPSDGCLKAGILLFPELPQNSPAPIGGLQSLMIVTSLFTDMAGAFHFTM